jgi:hypothetical protein
MRGEVWAAALIIVVLVGAGSGYLFGNANVHTTTSISATTITSVVTTVAPPSEPCNTRVWTVPPPISLPMPVLLMRPNSTGFVCVVFQTAWKGNASLLASNPELLAPYLQSDGSYSFYRITPINWKCGTGNGPGGCTQSFPNSFKVSVAPSSIIPSGSTNQVVIVYEVTAYSNSTGFYDEFTPWGSCRGLPMAVGYSASQVNASDFTPPPAIPCPIQPFNSIAEYVTGMNVIYIN